MSAISRGGDDTIAAIATAAGAAGIGIIRISGAKALPLARLLLGREPQPRLVHRVKLPDQHGETIDDGLLLCFRAPHSFTGEDVVELQGHGSPVVLNMLMAMLLQRGIRRADPGEFSQRAFLNGKLDLVQAEAIADLIASQSELSARAALRSLQGQFSSQIHVLLRQLIELRMWIEAAIDFPEEEIDFLADGQLLARAVALQTDIAVLLQAAERGQRMRDGLYVVIVGPPNAGKSSLLNYLSGSQSAIVTELAGTTRDVLREQILVHGVAVTLVDTAGLRESQDRVERIGIARARDELRKADLALLLRAMDSPPDERLSCGLELADAARQLHVVTKADLYPPAQRMARMQPDEIAISVETGEGIASLTAAIAELAGLGESAEGGFSARARHTTALAAVHASCMAAVEQLRARQGELAADDLRAAQRSLSAITGEFSADDLLGQIFGSFCIGK